VTQHSGRTRPIWMRYAPPSSAPLTTSAHADVCVIGAGIAGLTAAYLLAREGRKVIVLEDRTIGDGETGRTTAHLSNALDDRYSVLEKVHGPEGARLAAAGHTAAIECIESIVAREQIDCAFLRVDGYLARHPEGPADLLERELAAAHRAGLDEVSMLNHAPVRSFTDGAVLRFPRQGQFHPLRYLAGLAQAIAKSGGMICTHSRVRSVEDGKPARALLENGHTVSAQAIIVATNSPISDRLAIHTKQAPYRTYAISLAVQPGEVPQALFWDTGDPYHYVRTYTAEDGSVSLIVGGEDHKTGQANDGEVRFARLEAWTRTHFPMAGELQEQWSGQVMEPVDHLAFIGRDPGAKHLYIATGDSGHGMTHGTIAGLLLTDIIMGRENAWTDLYAPERKSLKSAGTYAHENLNVARQFADHVRPGEVADASEIERGCGALLRRGAHMLAVYRDEQGALHSRSAVCTHVGCVVHWNATEKSWDCPCHGSRFAIDGQVISGPAHTPLAADDKA
jgi:glycine/D-amino acid oxidase-like deaminating enzyme/nitrite reductase/ring-hydroxylating ferredoxin subunit